MPKKIFTNKYDMLLVAIGSVLLILIIAVLFYSINFMVKNINAAFNPGLIKTEEVVTFNLGELEKIKSVLEK